MGRCLLSQGNLDKTYWVRALATAAYIRNMSIGASTEKTPFQLFKGKEPDFQRLKVFGCLAYVLKRKGQLKKLDQRSTKAKFIGYEDCSKAYIVQELETKRVIRARNVVFDETQIPKLGENKDEQEPDLDFAGFPTIEDVIESEGSSAQVGEQEENLVEESEESQPEVSEATSALPRGQRTRQPPEFYGDVRVHNSTSLSSEPSTYKEAIESKDSTLWWTAMASEYQALVDNDTWTLVEKPKDRSVVPGKWVFKIKQKADGSVDKFKARYVAKGFKQVEGLDFHETFAPTSRPETFRLIVALAAQKDLVLEQLDVKSAYLHSPIEETIFLEQPEGFEKKSTTGEKLVCKLNKSIYGLKQAARNWNKSLESFLLSIEFQRSKSDSCLFTRKESQGHTYVLTWVDDIIVCSPDEQTVKDLKETFAENYEMDDRGKLSWFLGMRITRSDDSISIDQEQNISSVLKEFSMSDCKPVSTPAQVNLKFDNDAGPVDNRLYRQLIGSVLHIGKNTRPDILNTVNILSRYLGNPNMSHWSAGKHLLRYLKATADCKLVYPKNAGPAIVGEADADWCGDVIDRRSTSGHYFKFVGQGAAISWEVKKQQTVALSSSEAEYQSMASAVQEAIHLRNLLEELGCSQNESIMIGEDNQSCIKMCENPVMQKRTKHIDCKYHFIRERVEDGTVKIHYVPSAEMAADILTKPLPAPAVKKHRRVLLGVTASSLEETSV